ncbi:MFS transporter [Microbacterium album]|uniref:MFS transporter n=1 Tax=Microbacterium album TaxID=2053191 RepID=A0A917IGM9_9MICO|nr:MFS transporter [Microbacterium album]GGH47943.1 MFS transporter [Microbacterium album]
MTTSGGSRGEARQDGRVLGIAILASFVAFLDSSIVNVALPAIRDELGGGLAGQQWVVNAYLVTLGALILVAGSMSDQFGRLRTLRLGLAGFLVTSLAVAAAPTLELLIAARAVQGVAGALLVPSSLALITSHFDEQGRGRAIGAWTAATSAAMLVAPLLGGLFIDLASWRWAFAINVLPIAAAFLLLAGLRARDVRRADARVDLVASACCALGLGGIVFALIEGPERGWADPLVAAVGCAGAVLFAVFVWGQRRPRASLMPLVLFRAGNFRAGNLATLFVYAALALNGFAVVVYLQQGAGLGATLAGLATLPMTVVMMLGSARVGAWAGRRGPRLFMALGPAIMAVGATLLLTVSAAFDYWLQVLPGVLLMGVGLTLTVSPLTSAVLGAVDPERSGVASAVNNAVARVAGLLAIAVLALIAGGDLDLEGFHRTAIATAVLFAAGSTVSWIGIRNTARTSRGTTNRPPAR